MVSHQDIWSAIDYLAAEKNISVSALARRAGLDVTTLSKSKRMTEDGRKRWPSMETVSLLLEAVDMDFKTFADIVDALSRSRAEIGQLAQRAR